MLNRLLTTFIVTVLAFSASLSYAITTTCTSAYGSWQFFLAGDGSSLNAVYNGTNLDGQSGQFVGSGTWDRNSRTSWVNYNDGYTVSCVRISGGDFGSSTDQCSIANGPGHIGTTFMLNCNTNW